MNRLLLLHLLFLGLQPCWSQPISWITNCSEKNFCFNTGSCTQGAVYMVEKAVTNCGSPNINYSYKIDLNNDGSVDVQSSEDTVRGNYNKGTHKVIWRASDNCGSVIQCSYLFTIKDCAPPNVVCINGLTQTIDPPNCNAIFQASQFILSMSDNCIPSNQLELGIRKTGTGTGFPSTQSIEYGLCENGFHQVEVWVRDNNGLTNQCSNYVLVQIGAPECECNQDGDLQFTTCAREADSKRLTNYRAIVSLQSPAGAQTPYSKVKTIAGLDSCLTVPINEVPFDADYVATIRADKPDAALNGVTTFDLVMISKHILGIEALTSAYQMEAADVNNSNSITTFDIVETRKLILGIYDTLPQAPSWRFVRPLSNPSVLGSYTSMVDTYQVKLTNLQADLNFSGFSFVGIKYGDVNYSAEFNGPADDRSPAPPIRLKTTDRVLAAGEIADIPFQLDDCGLEGWQLALKTDPDALAFLSVEGIPDGNFVLRDHALRALAYAGETPAGLPCGFTLRVRALSPIRISQALSIDDGAIQAEGYVAGSGPSHLLRRPIVFSSSAGQIAFLGAVPNPFSDQVDFQLNNESAATAAVEIFNLDGKKVYSEDFELESGVQAIRLSGASLPAEKILFYRIRVEGEVFSGKLIKQ